MPQMTQHGTWQITGAPLISATRFRQAATFLGAKSRQKMRLEIGRNLKKPAGDLLRILMGYLILLQLSSWTASSPHGNDQSISQSMRSKPVSSVEESASPSGLSIRLLCAKPPAQPSRRCPAAKEAKQPRTIRGPWFKNRSKTGAKKANNQTTKQASKQASKPGKTKDQNKRKQNKQTTTKLVKGKMLARSVVPRASLSEP